MKVLVTGSSGFLGSFFLNFLEKNNIQYIVYDRKNPEKLTLDFDSVVNFGGLTPNSDIKNNIHLEGEYHSANVLSTKLLLETIKKNKNIRRFVNIGTVAECGFSKLPITEHSEQKPSGHYGKSKLEQTKLIEKFSKEKKISVINLRLFNIAGLPKRCTAGECVPKNPFIFESLINQFCVDFNGTIKINNKYDTRDYVDIDDIMEAILLSLKMEHSGKYELINICSGTGVSLDEIVRLFGGVLEKKWEIISHGEIENASFSTGNNSKAKKVLNWSPKISLEESIKKMICQKIK